MGIQRENIRCTVCNWKTVETEEHFLLDCPLYEKLRTKLFSIIGDPKFNHLSRNAQFKYLLTHDNMQS